MLPQKTERFSSRQIQRYATSLRMRSLIVNSLATANLQRNFWKKPIHIRLIVRNLLLLMNPVCRKLSLQSVVACVAGRIEFFCSAGTCFANVLFARIIPLHSAYRFNVNKLNFRIFLHFVRWDDATVKAIEAKNESERRIDEKGDTDQISEYKQIIMDENNRISHSENLKLYKRTQRKQMKIAQYEKLKIEFEEGTRCLNPLIIL